MVRKVLFEWPDFNLKATGTLADDKNPELCQDIWDNLPFESIMNHSVVSGNSMYCWTSLLSFAPIHYKEPLNEAPIGRIRYGQNDGNKIIIQYSEVYDDVKGTVLGAIDPEYIDIIKKIGHKAKESVFLSKELLRVRVSRFQDEDGCKPCKTNYQNDYSISTEVEKLANAISTETRRITFNEPEELKRVRTGGSMGSFNQYFSTWEFVYGFLRDLSMYTMYPIAKMARREDISVETLSLIFKELTPHYVSYLGSWGLKKLRNYSQEFMNIIDKGGLTIDEFTSIIDAFCRYTNTLASWSYFYFPWGIGTCFRGPDKSLLREKK